MPALAGSHTTFDGGIVFTPQFGLDAGRRYPVDFDPSRLPAVGRNDAAWRRQPVVTIVTIPKPEATPSTVVTNIHPSAAVVPETAAPLRAFFETDGPSRRPRLHSPGSTKKGEEVLDPFLPLTPNSGWAIERGSPSS